jgi:CTP:molybdopterin cytidylyltransferase MocA
VSPRIGGVVLAAGAASRFGAPKQLAQLDDRPLLEHVLDAMAGAGLARVAVVLGSHADEVRAGVDLSGTEAIVAGDWGEGMAASLRAGVAAMRDLDGVVVALADQPWISAEAVARVARSAQPGCDAARATYDGRPGHPVLLSSSLFESVDALRGDQGARELLAQVTVLDVPCDGLGSPRDIDTRSDLEVVRK